MRRSMKITMLLFSFFMLTVSCSRGSSSLESLAMKGEYRRLLDKSQAEFARTYSKASLYYQALAQHQLGMGEQSGRSLELYLAMFGEDQISEAAAKLAVVVGSQTNRAELVRSMGLWLEKRQLLDSVLAKPVYEALLKENRLIEAHAIFTTHLRSTLDAKEYASILINADAEFLLVKEALEDMDAQSIVELLAIASQRPLDVESASRYLNFAISFESARLPVSSRRQLYMSLARFASQADQRVLINKYQSLAQSL